MDLTVVYDVYDGLQKGLDALKRFCELREQLTSDNADKVNMCWIRIFINVIVYKNKPL